jgi:hypothetical protein
VDLGVILKVIKHKHLDKPTAAECYGTEMPEVLWELVMQCWAADPNRQPNMNDVSYTLEKLIICISPFHSYGTSQTDKCSVISHPVQY